jgi:redox-regulated HSP33 family molecular chaperone
MSLADPNTITVSGTPISLPRVSTGDNRSEYLSGDGNNRLTVSHDYGKRYRRMVRFDTSKIAADVFDTSENVKKSMSTYIVFDVPDVGYTAAEALAVWVGFNTLLTATSNAVVSKVLGGES